MPFVNHPGLPGRVYVPEPKKNRKQKHPCPDCLDCQMCSESRCRVCRKSSPPDHKNRGLSEKGVKIDDHP